MVDAAASLARTPGGIAVATLENAGADTLARGITTFGQVFAAGELPANGTLYAVIGNTTVPVQVDVKTTWPDGSAKMAVITLERPPLAAGETANVVLVADTAPEAPALDLASSLNGHSFSVTLTPVGGSAVTFDVIDALRHALADGTASFWQDGPLATQARVEILVPNSSQRLVFDVTAFQDGSFQVDAQFNNDRAMEATGGLAQYGLTVTMDGHQLASENITQYQYQNWHESFSSSAVNGGQGLGDPTGGWLNIVQDVAKLEALGVVPHYDLSLAVPESLLNNYATATQSAGWGDPLSNNDVTTYMGMTGGRGDIGFTTQGNAAWLLSGDARAAAYALGQAEAAGAVPWNFYDAANGTWLNTDNYPKLWTDYRGGTGRPGDPSSTGLTQQISSSTGWGPDTAHQPNLSFVPYVMTGERWMLDNLQAQAAFNIMSYWPALRENGSDLLVQGNQVRGAAWSMRELEDAAWAAPDGSPEKAYLRAAADANWQWLVSKIPEWTAMQGEAHGWVPGEYGTPGCLPPWQQDFFASSAILAASRGNADALTFLNWQKNFLIGRFEHAADGFAFNDGATYLIAVSDPATKRVFTTWSEIGATTAAWDLSNGTGWSHSDGYFGELALATLAGIYHLTGDADALAAYDRLIAANPPWTGAGDFARDTSYAVTIPGKYGWGIGDDVVALDTTVVGGTYDLSSGVDKLILADGGNVIAVRNAETVIGGSGADIVTIVAMEAPLTIDLGKGSDRLVLPNGGWNTISVANVERIIGGTGVDMVTLTTAESGTTVDLAGGNDQLTLSSAGPNVVTVRNVETVLGGSADDAVSFISNALPGTIVSLGAGQDVLTLLGGGANTVGVYGVETIVGGAGKDTVSLLYDGTPIKVAMSSIETVIGSWVDDAVTFTAPVAGASVDLGDGYDSLSLSGAGPNTLSVARAESIYGGAADDDVTLTSFIWGAKIDLGAGEDRLHLSATTGNNVFATNVETVVGGAYDDIVTLGAPAQDVLIDLGGGNDTLNLSTDGPNRLTVRNVEMITGGTRFDAIFILAPEDAGDVAARVGAQQPSTMNVSGIDRVKGSGADEVVNFYAEMHDTVVNLSGGRDKLVLYWGGTNTVSASRVETIQGWGGADTVTVLDTGNRDTAIDLGGNYDTVIFATEAGDSESAFVANVETILGGAGDETVTLTTSAYRTVVDLGRGRDRLDLGNFDNLLSVGNTERILGNAGADNITVTTGGGSLVDGAGGNDTLVGGAGADTLQGGAGTDLLTGGAGADRFFFPAAANSAVAAPDVITDFDVTQDQLAFAGLQGNFAYLGTAAFTGAGHSEARYAQGTVLVDINGDASADIGVQLTGAKMASLTAAHFVWL